MKLFRLYPPVQALCHNLGLPVAIGKNLLCQCDSGTGWGADVGGQYLNEWQTAKATWVTTVRRFNNTPLPKTGY